MKITIRSITAATSSFLTLVALSLQASEDGPKPYPLKRCIVSDEPLGASGMTPHQFVYEGQTIKLCCKGCLEDFDKEPAKYLKKLEDAGK